MPWKDVTLEMRRGEFVERALSGETSKIVLCREFGISRPTGDKWIRRFVQGEPMCDHSRRPFKVRNKVAVSIEQLVLDCRKEFPFMGSAKILRVLQNRGVVGLPRSSNTVNAILKRNGCISEAASAASRPYQCFVKLQPNQMWQADFTGHFAMGSQQRCHPLNILDDHSRFNLCCDALEGENFECVRRSLMRVFGEYGLPQSFLCDHGPPWGTASYTGITKFQIWFMDLGILVLHGRVRHPQTQGKEERFNRTQTDELLHWTTISYLQDAQAKFSDYRTFYNHERPHHSLGLDTPAEHYQRSPRSYPQSIKEWEYPASYALRKVQQNGYFDYLGHGYLLTESLAGKTIAIRPSHIEDNITLCYREFKIGRIDLSTHAFTRKGIYLAKGDPRNKHKPQESSTITP